ncbi:aldose 1-epimerase [Paenibacillus sp. IHBB 10380]|uniref:aldose 1-epimerase n=1 Tax=Paenibacillus sp. IHBB 10380 TaxID=1566358 RepID=UPI0005CFD7CA|nr:aldose 1-epimerase [Paenibacillus sp. IHBB 10380]AJS60081.1 galactose mutarotase [Paenibacillus sp. IHBB 10380]
MKKVTKGKWNDFDTYILHSHNLEITLLPQLGNNVIAIWDKLEQRHVIRPPDEQDLDFYMLKPYHFGMPMLIPPGRIRDGQFTFEGKNYQFDRNTAGDHHIHGLHRTQAWCVSDIQEDEECCIVTTEFNTADDAKWMAQYPAPLKLEMTFKLQGAKFTQHLKVKHLGEGTIPFGIGYHSWFLLDGRPEQWKLQVPVKALYDMDHDLLINGELLPLNDLEELNSGLNLKDTNFDTLLRADTEQPTEAILLHEDGYGIKYAADRRYFKHWVLYTKGIAHDYLCIEPYTWLPNAPNLTQGPELTGLITLEPQQSFETELYLEIINRPSVN